MIILAASAGLMLIAHIAIVAKNQGQLGWGAAPVALLAIFNTTGRVVSGACLLLASVIRALRTRAPVEPEQALVPAPGKA